MSHDPGVRVEQRYDRRLPVGASDRRKIVADDGAFPPVAGLPTFSPARVLVSEDARPHERRTATVERIDAEESQRRRVRVEQLLDESNEPEVVSAGVGTGRADRERQE